MISSMRGISTNSFTGFTRIVVAVTAVATVAAVQELGT
jgi:hypothetical protein